MNSQEIDKRSSVNDDSNIDRASVASLQEGSEDAGLKVVIVIVVLALIFISIIAYFVSQMPAKS